MKKLLRSTWIPKKDTIMLWILTLFIFLILYLLNQQIETFENEEEEEEKKEEEKKTKNEIVISRYNEDLSFLLNDDFKKYRDHFDITIYNKGPDITNQEIKDLCKIHQLPNVGRECHTFLYHIIENYDNLSDLTIFLPGSFYNTPFKKERAMKILDLAYENKDQEEQKSIFFVQKADKPIREFFKDFTIDSYVSSSNENKQILKEEDHRIQNSPERPYYQWFDKNFHDNKTNLFFYNCIFSVCKDDILKNDIEIYNKLMNYLKDHKNPEVGHYMERSWCALFNPDPDTLHFF